MKKLYLDSCETELINSIIYNVKIKPEKKMIEMAITNGIVDMVYWENAKEIKKIKFLIRQRNKEIEEEISDIKEIFDKNKIIYSIMKSHYLNQKIYKNKVRYGGDIDIAINGKHIEKAENILASMDYKNPRGWKPKEISKQYSMVKIKKNGVFINFDVHKELFNSTKLNNIVNFSQINKELNDFEQITFVLLHFLNEINKSKKIKIMWIIDLLEIYEYLVREKKLKEFLLYLNEIDLKNTALQLVQIVKAGLKIKSKKRNLKKDRFYYLLEENSNTRIYLNEVMSKNTINKSLTHVIETFLPPKEEIMWKKGENIKKSDYIIRFFNGLKRMM